MDDRWVNIGLPDFGVSQFDLFVGKQADRQCLFNLVVQHILGKRVVELQRLDQQLAAIWGCLEKCEMVDNW